MPPSKWSGTACFKVQGGKYYTGGVEGLGVPRMSPDSFALCSRWCRHLQPHAREHTSESQSSADVSSGAPGTFRDQTLPSPVDCGPVSDRAHGEADVGMNSSSSAGRVRLLPEGPSQRSAGVLAGAQLTFTRA